MDQKNQTSGQTFTNSPDEKFLLMILRSKSKLENDNRSENVKRGLGARCRMGIRPEQPPIGYKLVRSEYFSEPSIVEIDKERVPFIKKAFDYLVKEKLSGKQVWEYLVDEGFTSRSRKVPPLSVIFRILKDTFYYGEFEFPKGSGNKYKGKHEPLIPREIFDEARKCLKTSDKGKCERKNFYFNHILKCRHCESGISGESHINRHGKEYIYYKCNKHGGRKSCKSKYIREEKLLKEVSNIVVNVKEEYLQMNRRIKEDLRIMNRYHKENPITIYEHLVSILKDGSKKEKSDILRNFKDKLF